MEQALSVGQMANENEFLLHALMMGIFVTFVYDILRIFRRVIPHRDFFVSLEDLCFWTYCGGEVFLLMYHESNGTLRWFAVLGALVGMLLYRKLVSFWFVKYVSLAIKKILEKTAKVVLWICRPLVIVCKKADKCIKNKLTYFLKMLKITLKTK